MLILCKLANETWKEAAFRTADRHGLKREVSDLYDEMIKSGSTEEQAAYNSCYEWDVLDVRDESEHK